jgi:outer membrane lipoprotein SlyB
MTSESSSEKLPHERTPSDTHPSAPSSKHHPLAAGIGAATGGVAGAAVGRAVGGHPGSLVGAIAGAVTGGMVGNTMTDDLKAIEHEVAETLGEAAHEDELPAHYSWEQLQALSRPQT